jgi:hypothetical protein
VVHWFLLHPLDDFRSLLWASDTLVHIIVPVLVVLGWLVFGPRRRISVRVVLLGLVWPVLWLLYTLAVGWATGWYPYFFLDIEQTGAGGVALYCAAILILLFLVSCLFWIGDRCCRVADRRGSRGMTSRRTLLGCGLQIPSDNQSSSLARYSMTRRTTLPCLPRAALRVNAARASASGKMESISGLNSPMSARRASSRNCSRSGSTTK